MKAALSLFFLMIFLTNFAFAQVGLPFQSHAPNAFQMEIMQREADLRILEEEINTHYWVAGTSVAVTVTLTTLSLIGFRQPLARGVASFRERFMAKSTFKKAVSGLGATASAGIIYLTYDEIVEIRHRIAVARAKLRYARETVDALRSRAIPAAMDKCSVDESLKPAPRS